ncbi:MAG: DUF2478 domain-containing protein [Hyphomicrobiaceae bacterium]
MVQNSGRVPLAAIAYQRGFDVDGLLLASCAELQSRGLRVGGVIQSSSSDPAHCASQIHVVDLRSGEAFNIWEDRGSCSRGCRLDERGLIDAEPSIMRSLADGVDLIVINRFGRAESLGRGLLGCFMAAVESGVSIVRHVDFAPGGRLHHRLVHIDATVIERPLDRSPIISRRSYIVEVDRGSMPLERANFLQTSIERKFSAYINGYANNLHESLFGWKAFRILFVTNTEIGRATCA